MKLFMVHAPERCKPCRDMGERLSAVRHEHPDLFVGDYFGLIHADHEAEKLGTVGGARVLPAFILQDDKGEELFRAEGRITKVLATKLLQACQRNNFDESEFLDAAPSANVVFYRTYARRTESDQRETYAEAIHRVVDDIADLGKFSADEKRIVLQAAEAQHCLPSGRWLWTGGTDWIRDPRNFSGAYNCTSTDVSDPEAFGLMMELAMMGSGTGAVLEQSKIDKLPEVMTVINLQEVTAVGEVGGNPDTEVKYGTKETRLIVGDSRRGWCSAYQQIIDWAMTDLHGKIDLVVDLSQVRPAGERLKGFGGVANPVKLGEMFEKVCSILANAHGRRLTSIEACLLIDEASAAVVAGNIRRSAGMSQFAWDDTEASNAKDNLYSQDSEGNWRVDPTREALRMANHTRCAHKKPDLAEVVKSVTKQFHSGEGAIQYVPEAVARSNVDLLPTEQEKIAFLEMYEDGWGRDFLCAALDAISPEMDKAAKDRELDHRMGRYGLNPCGEILGQDFHCNLAEVHLNNLDPKDNRQQQRAFEAAGLQVAALLHHEFAVERYQYSRSIDPIVGVSFTGLFDFFVNAFGSRWLMWMMAGRPQNNMATEFEAKEEGYLKMWRNTVRDTVVTYCAKHGMRVPNRMTTVQPAGTKSLLTGASSGWHPPKAQRFIRRITVGANDPVALAAIDYGYNVIPAQSARDDDGNLLDDIHDPRSREWLIEIPTEVSWANLPGCDRYDLSKLSAAAQWGLYMQVQNHYTEHNTSATIEFREDEIEELSALIHQGMGNGYISAALLARFDANATFPRLPFEPISKEKYDELMVGVYIRRSQGGDGNFHRALSRHDSPEVELTTENACTSAACLAQAEKAEREGL